jgi:hypothetical protein
LTGSFLAIQVPQYQSNAAGTCITGFSSMSMPAIQNVSLNGTFPATAVTITGAGFGSVASPFRVPTSNNLPYLGMQDQSATPTWQAGNSLNSDTVGLTVTSWTDTSISISGFSAPNPSVAMQANDSVTAWVCNPSSGNCDSHSATANAGGSCAANATCCPVGQAACGATCCPNPSDICDPTTTTCMLGCTGGCATGQLCCEGINGAPQCVNPIPRNGLTWCGEVAPNQIFCNNCPANQQCIAICNGSGGLCTTDLYCQ